MPSTEILVAMMVWISTITGLPVPETPQVHWSDGKTMKMMLYGCDMPAPMNPELCAVIEGMDIESRDNNTLGLYDHHEHVIYLNPSLKKMHPVVRDSVLVHELVHAMQFPAGVEFQCFGQLEELAYEVQDKYLKKNGRQDIFHELDLSPLFLFITFSCDDGAFEPGNDTYNGYKRKNQLGLEPDSLNPK